MSRVLQVPLLLMVFGAKIVASKKVVSQAKITANAVVDKIDANVTAAGAVELQTASKNSGGVEHETFINFLKTIESSDEASVTKKGSLKPEIANNPPTRADILRFQNDLMVGDNGQFIMFDGHVNLYSTFVHHGIDPELGGHYKLNPTGHASWVIVQNDNAKSAALDETGKLDRNLWFEQALKDYEHVLEPRHENSVAHIPVSRKMGFADAKDAKGLKAKFKQRKTEDPLGNAGDFFDFRMAVLQHATFREYANELKRESDERKPKPKTGAKPSATPSATFHVKVVNLDPFWDDKDDEEALLGIRNELYAGLFDVAYILINGPACGQRAQKVQYLFMSTPDFDWSTRVRITWVDGFCKGCSRTAAGINAQGKPQNIVDPCPVVCGLPMDNTLDNALHAQWDTAASDSGLKKTVPPATALQKTMVIDELGDYAKQFENTTRVVGIADRPGEPLVTDKFCGKEITQQDAETLEKLFSSDLMWTIDRCRYKIAVDKSQFKPFIASGEKVRLSVFSAAPTTYLTELLTAVHKMEKRNVEVAGVFFMGALMELTNPTKAKPTPQNLDTCSNWLFDPLSTARLFNSGILHNFKVYFFPSFVMNLIPQRLYERYFLRLKEALNFASLKGILNSPDPIEKVTPMSYLHMLILERMSFTTARQAVQASQDAIDMPAKCVWPSKYQGPLKDTEFKEALERMSVVSIQACQDHADRFFCLAPNLRSDKGEKGCPPKSGNNIYQFNKNIYVPAIKGEDIIKDKVRPVFWKFKSSSVGGVIQQGAEIELNYHDTPYPDIPALFQPKWEGGKAADVPKDMLLDGKPLEVGQAYPLALHSPSAKTKEALRAHIEPQFQKWANEVVPRGYRLLRSGQRQLEQPKIQDSIDNTRYSKLIAYMFLEASNQISADDYKIQPGYLEGKPIHKEKMTLGEAKAKCHILPSCEAFYYTGKVETKAIENPNHKKQFWFHSNQDVLGYDGDKKQTHWTYTSYLRRENFKERDDIDVTMCTKKERMCDPSKDIAAPRGNLFEVNFFQKGA